MKDEAVITSLLLAASELQRSADHLKWLASAFQSTSRLGNVESANDVKREAVAELSTISAHLGSRANKLQD